MALDSSFSGLFDVPPQPGVLGPLPLDPSQGQMSGLLPTPPAPQPTMGVLDTPGDPSSLFGPTFNAAELAGTAVPPGGQLALAAAQMRAIQTIRDQLGDPFGWLTPRAGQGGAGSTAAAPAPAVQPPPANGAAVAAGPTIGASTLSGADPSRQLTLDPTYTVQPGDNLSTVGGRYVATGRYPDVRTAVGAITRANGLASSMVLPGQLLTVPSSTAPDDARRGGALIDADAQLAAARRLRAGAANSPGLIQGLAVGGADATAPWNNPDSVAGGDPVFTLAGPALVGAGIGPSVLSAMGGAGLSSVRSGPRPLTSNRARQAGEAAELAGNLADDATAGLGETMLAVGGPRALARAEMIDRFGRLGPVLELGGAGVKTYVDAGRNLHSPALATAAVHDLVPTMIDVGGGMLGTRLGGAVGGPEGAILGGVLGGLARPEAQNWWNNELMTLRIPGGPALVGQQLANIRAGAG